MITRKVTLKITHSREDEIELIDDSSNIKLNPILKVLRSDKVEEKYINLWRGKYRIRSNSREYSFEASKSTFSKITENISITTNVNFGPRYLDRTAGSLRSVFIKHMSKIGWNYTISTADKLLCVCQYLCEVAKKEINKTGIVCPIGISTDNVTNATRTALNHPSVIIIQNHQIEDKSKALIDFASVIKQLPNVTFYVSRGLPENRDNSFYKKVIEVLSKQKNVQFVDIDSSNKFDYLSSADIYVLASGLDCTPATILEASLAKKPILASAVGGVPEMILEGKTGWAIPNGDHKLWIEKINFLVSNPDAARKIGLAAKERVLKKYDYKIIANNIYKELTS